LADKKVNSIKKITPVNEKQTDQPLTVSRAYNKIEPANAAVNTNKPVSEFKNNYKDYSKDYSKSSGGFYKDNFQ
jgi:hypothetical protein